MIRRSVRTEEAARPYERFARSYPEFVAEVRQFKIDRHQALQRLGQMSGDRQRGEVRRLLRSNRLHLSYAHDAVRRVGSIGNATPESIRELASRCNPFVPVRDEPVITREVNKGSGRRIVQDFGPRRRMHHALVADILRQTHPPLPTQRLLNGGMPTALQAVATAAAEGCTHGVEVDFVNFYGSIRHERLAELLRPLPATVVDNTVWDFALRDDPRLSPADRSVSDPNSSALTGLSLGSAISPIVGEVIIAQLLTAAQHPETITYADNLFVTGRSEEEVAARIDRIRGSAASLDVGRLEFRVGASRAYDLTQPFEFVKQQGQLIVNGSGRIKAKRMTWQPARLKIEQYAAGAAERSVDEAAIVATAQRLRHWRRAYPQWQDGDAFETENLAALAARRYYCNRSSANLTLAIHAVFVAQASDGGWRQIEEFVPTEGDPTGEARRHLLQAVRQWLAAAQDRAPLPEPLTV